MKDQQKSCIGLICLAVLFAALLVTAGCLGSAQGPQGPATATSTKQSEHPAAGTAATTKATTVPTPLKTVKPTPAPGLSTAGIAIDPIGDKKAGEKFLLTATTTLPVGTVLLWQIMPDTGTPPTGLDGNSMMSVGGNNVVRKGDGTSNQISQDVDLGALIPGKYVVIIGEMKGKFIDYEIGDRRGYTYFTLK